MLPRMKALDLYWVEEPIWPPEDFETLARLEEQFGVALAAGENACTAFQFQDLIPAVTFIQPSVTKIGGILEFMKVVDAARLVGKAVMPHSPYFGPGWWATLQLAAHAPEIGLIEYLYIEIRRRDRQGHPAAEEGHDRDSRHARPRLRAGLRRDRQVQGGVRCAHATPSSHSVIPRLGLEHPRVCLRADSHRSAKLVDGRAKPGHDGVGEVHA